MGRFHIKLEREGDLLKLNFAAEKVDMIIEGWESTQWEFSSKLGIALMCLKSWEKAALALAVAGVELPKGTAGNEVRTRLSEISEGFVLHFIHSLRPWYHCWAVLLNVLFYCSVCKSDSCLREFV